MPAPSSSPAWTAEARDELEVPVRAVVEPRVERDVALEPAQPADEIAEQLERGREER